MKFKSIISITLVFSMLVGCQSNMQPIEEPPVNDVKIIEEQVKEPAYVPIDKNTLEYEIIHNTPSITREDIMYFIMVDRFYDGNEENNVGIDKIAPKGFHGGDMTGIINKLDYLQSINTTAIWLTPIVENEFGGYHGYWAKDFYAVDSHFGSLEKLKELVNEAHKRGIKVILDHVVNHTGPNTEWLRDEEKTDWFHEKADVNDWNDQDQVEDRWLLNLPDLNTENPEVREYLIDNALWWIEQTDVDGMRLDTVKHVPKSFWNEFSYKIKSKHPDFFLMGEVWHSDTSYLNDYYEVGLDSLVNYPMFDGFRNTFKRYGKTTPLINAIKMQSGFDAPELSGLFLDNHDNSRFVNNALVNKEEYLKQGLTFMMSYPGIPIVYYGTEIAMSGSHDPNNRKDMDFDSANEDNDMFKFYKFITDLRTNEPAMTMGDFTFVYYDEQVMVYNLEYEGDTLLFMINVYNDNIEKTFETDKDMHFESVIDDSTYHLENQSSLTMEALEIKIFKNVQ